MARQPREIYQNDVDRDGMYRYAPKEDPGPIETELIEKWHQEHMAPPKPVKPRSDDRIGITCIFLAISAVCSIGGSWAMFGAWGLGSALTIWGVVAMVVGGAVWYRWDLKN